MVINDAASPQKNRLLAAMDTDARDLVQPFLQPVTFERRRQLEFPNKPIDNVYFVEEGIVSVVANAGVVDQAEVGLIGREGMTGVPVVLSTCSSPHAAYAQVGGRAQRLSANVLVEAMDRFASLRRSLLRYAQSYLVQMAHAVVANARASIEERVARWILMAHDRVDDDEVPLTHEYLAWMLGMRRASVTDALSALVDAGLVRVLRGGVVVRDRRGLQARAGRFYGVPEAEYARVLGPAVVRTVVESRS